MLAIFPGHVGKDSGAVDGVDRHNMDTYHTIEAVINSIISTKVCALLSLTSIPYRLYTGSLKDRVNKANGVCDFGISIHCNAATTPEVNGFEMFHYPNSVSGTQLANVIHGYFKNFNIMNGEVHGTPVKERSDLYVLRKTTFPTVLVECGFLTNQIEEYLLNEEFHQNRIALAIASSILDYTIWN